MSTVLTSKRLESQYQPPRAFKVLNSLDILGSKVAHPYKLQLKSNDFVRREFEKRGIIGEKERGAFTQRSVNNLNELRMMRVASQVLMEPMMIQ